MDINKENMNGNKVKSKIPLPLQPLPILPKNLLERNQMRCPLKNINRIQISETESRKCPLKIDSKHVTVRKSEDLDWEYEVFKDDKIISSSVISDAGPSNDSKKKFIENKCQEQTKIITPLKSRLELNKIKNVKRSLKRPHSRELQGLSPVTKEKREKENFRRRLDFKTVNNVLSKDVLDKKYMTCLTRHYTTDVYEHLLRIEKKNAIPSIRTIPRACVLNWLIKISGNDGNPAIIQTAQWYLDSLLAICHIHVEFLQLVTSACYWIAQKTYGPVITAKKLVRCSSYAFTVGKLVSVEKSVLSKLRFPTVPVIPQDFISYMSWYCDSSMPNEIEMAATFICVTALMTDKSLCNEYPSVIAAAAMRNALLLLDKKSLLTKLHNNYVFKCAEAKASNFYLVCSAHRKAVCTISSPLYKYKAPLEQYGAAPHFIAQRIVTAANELQRIQCNTA